MARVHRVAKSAKEHICGRGGHVIPKGAAYTWAKPGFRTRTPLIRCAAHPFRPSELTTSMASAPMAAQEALEDTMAEIDRTADEALDELRTALEEFQGEVRSYAEDRQYALDAWENGNSTLEELAETAETAASEAEGVEVEDWDEPEPERGDYDDEDEYERELEDYAERKQQHIDDQFEAVESMLGSLEF